MRRVSTVAALTSLLALAACQQQGQLKDDKWFTGSFEEAQAVAEQRGTMLLLDFYSET